MIIVDPRGVAVVVVDSVDAANDDPDRQQRRAEVACRTSTPEGLAGLVDDLGPEEAARRLHDAMFGEAAARETPAVTPAGAAARAWRDVNKPFKKPKVIDLKEKI